LLIYAGAGIHQGTGTHIGLSTEGEEVSAFDQCRLELFFGAMVFKPNRQARRPPGTDQALHRAAYELWEETKKKEDKHSTKTHPLTRANFFEKHVTFDPRFYPSLSS
jgi:hypothetical protein